MLVNEEGTIVPFVLYLRPFRVRDLFATMNEENLGTAVSGIGIPVCVGRPGERLPPSGFHRLYFAESDWRDSVMAMAAESHCIAVLLAPGGDVVWEMDQSPETMAVQNRTVHPVQSPRSRSGVSRPTGNGRPRRVATLFKRRFAKSV